MANADGGELVVGIEDDGAVTGVPHPADKVGLFLRAPGDRNYVHPPLRYQTREMRTQDEALLLHLAVEWSPEVHRLADGRYLLRVSDANMPFPAGRSPRSSRQRLKGSLSGLSPWVPPWTTWISTWWPH